MQRRAILHSIIAVLLNVCTVALFQPNVARADELYASIRGTVTDQTGAAIPAVAVTATNTATGISQTVTSGPDGTYGFLRLAPGDYTVKAEKTGFKGFTTTKIHLDVNQVYALPVQMSVGEMTQEVTVQANGTQVESTTPQLGVVIDANQIVNMPLIGRDFVNLQQLEPGVVSASDRMGTTGPPAYSTNGSQSQMNVFLLDGTETNDIALNSPGLIPSPDAIAEFRMVTSTLNPEYARSSSAILNAVLKSGTNSFHGDAFDFYRDTFLNTRNYFAQKAPIYHQNLFGGTIGGPVIKNHTFFFFSYQGERAVAPQTNPIGPTIVTNVYTPAQLAGNFGAGAFAASTKSSPFPMFGDPCPVGGAPCAAGTPYSTLFASGNVPTQNFNSLAKSLVKKYVPLPNLVGNKFTFDASEPKTDDQYLFKIDQTFNSKDSLWGTYSQENFPLNDTVPFAGATLPGFGETNKENFRFVTVSWTHVINDHMLNELRLGYHRFNYHASFPTTPTLPSSAGFSITPQVASGAGLPVMKVQGLFTLGFSEFGPQPRIDQNYEGVDNFSLIEGRHTLKFGFDMRRWLLWNPFLTQNSGKFTFSASGTYSTGNPGADFLLGIPAFYAQASGGQQHNKAQQFYTYAQDQYKVRTNLTLTYGIGWTIDTPMINFDFNNHAQVAFRPGQQSVIFPNAPLGLVYQGDPGVHAAGETKYFKNFGPRLGFAYSPDWGRISGGPGRMSIRGGFGIYYNRSEQEQDLQVLGMPPFAITTVLGASGGVTINPSFANPFVDIATGTTIRNPYPYKGAPSNTPFTAANGFLPVFTSCCAVLDANTQDPMAENYNLTVERQLSDSMILSVGYVGSVAHHLTYGVPQNLGNSAGVFRYDVPTYGSVDTLYSGANSNYNSLQATLNKRLAHGLQFLAAYTYSHSLDQGSGFENTTFGGVGGGTAGFGGFGAIRTSNPYCFPGCDYASSIFDARQRLVLSYFYELPSLHSNSWMLSRLTKGWTIAGITTFQTGFPLDVADESGLYGGYLGAVSDFTTWAGPNMVAPVRYFNPRTAPNNAWFSASSFAAITPGADPTSIANYGNAPRNPLRGPGLNNWDFQVYKDTAITERTRVELRIEFYNVFNHTQFDPEGIITDISNPAFGTATQARDPRRIQLAAKVYF